VIGRGLLVLVVVLLPSSASAHALAPSYLQITLGDAEHHVTLKHARVAPRPVLQTPCRVTSLSRRDDGELVVIEERWSCPPEARLMLVTESGRPPLLVELAHGDVAQTLVLDASAPWVALEPDTAGAWTRWVVLGMEHLAMGLDHVLVIVGFVALVGLRRRLVWVLTAFTLGHSLSLGLAATGFVTLPPPVVEIAIALTLVGLGLELAAPAPARRPDPARRRPTWHLGVVGGAVGLIHGVGVVGVRADVVTARASRAVAPALVGFNVGLELAQLALVLVLALIARAAARLPLRVPVGALAGWLVGVAGAAWVVDRAWP